ncbi:MAG: hypothetical protein AVDCRST_MAG93-4269, partial [uncultured Chloroflexia bacterium]
EARPQASICRQHRDHPPPQSTVGRRAFAQHRRRGVQDPQSAIHAMDLPVVLQDQVSYSRESPYCNLRSFSRMQELVRKAPPIVWTFIYGIHWYAIYERSEASKL